MRVLIIGASGLLGKALTSEWTGDQVIGLSSKDADIRDSQQVLETVFGDIEGIVEESDCRYASKLPERVEFIFHKAQVRISVVSSPAWKAAERAVEWAGLCRTRQDEFTDRFGTKQLIVDRLRL